MIYYRCPYCHARVERGQKCGCGFKREYAAPTDTRKLYHTERWNRLRAMVMAMYNGVDQYSLSVYGKMEPASTIHHIVPAEEDPALFWTVSNLIPVSRSSHDEIHAAYRTGPEARTALQSQLKKIVSHHVENDF